MSAADARDVRIAARAIRGASWPGVMAEEMEQRSKRLELLADRMELAQEPAESPTNPDATP